MRNLKNHSASLAAAFVLQACSGAGMPGAALPRSVDLPRAVVAGNASSRITHVVIMIQENRSFDNLFATFPGADGTTFGYYRKKIKGGYARTKIALKKQTLAGLDVNHSYKNFNGDYDDGKMDGFNLAGINGNNPSGTYPYQYVDPKYIAPYWTIAQQYALADAMFQTQGSGSFTAHQDLIAGTTAGAWNGISGSIVDYPSESVDWGCKAPHGTVTSLLTPELKYLFGRGPFPCLSYPTGTLRDVLDAAGVSWKYYAPLYQHDTSGALWNAFAAIDAVYHGPEWSKNISMPETTIFDDITHSKLPAVSWLIPDQVDSDHPHALDSKMEGPSWVASVVNAIGTSKYWDSTAIVVVWDDWGGFYDHRPPPFFNKAGGLGFRVPMLVISPYVHAGTIAHTQYDFRSILKFVEENFALRVLQPTKLVTSIGNIFDLNMKPRKFVTIPSQHDRAYFLHEPPSNEPVDSE
jgi:phospholipase C